MKFKDVPLCPGIFVYRGYIWVKYAENFSVPLATVESTPDIVIEENTDVFAAKIEKGA